jgi:protein TonB
MFHVLLESAGRTPRRGGWVAASMAAHATVISGALVLTLRDHLPAVDQQVERVVLALPRHLAPQPATARQSGVPTVAPPTLKEIRVEIPSPPVIGIPRDPALSFGPVDMVGPGVLRDAFQRPPADGRAYSQHLVERAVIPAVDNPQPEYPATLRAAMIEGSVVLQFVVDSTGRVEPQSVSVLRPAHSLFIDSARRWLTRTRYTPAQIGGRPVRQLVQQELVFSLRP